MVITTAAAQNLKQYDAHTYTNDLGNGLSIYNPRQSKEENLDAMFNAAKAVVAAPVIELAALIPGFRAAKQAREEFRALIGSFSENLYHYRMHQAAEEVGVLPVGVELSDVQSFEVGLKEKLP